MGRERFLKVWELLLLGDWVKGLKKKAIGVEKVLTVLKKIFPKGPIKPKALNIWVNSGF